MAGLLEGTPVSHDAPLGHCSEVHGQADPEGAGTQKVRVHPRPSPGGGQVGRGNAQHSVSVRQLSSAVLGRQRGKNRGDVILPDSLRGLKIKSQPKLLDKQS